MIEIIIGLVLFGEFLFVCWWISSCSPHRKFTYCKLPTKTKQLCQTSHKPIYVMSRFPQLTINYCLFHINDEQKALIEEVIQAINALQIVKLVPTDTILAADIIIKQQFYKNEIRLGATNNLYYDHDTVDAIRTSEITIYTAPMWPVALNKIAFKHVVAHELGHALGLNHTPDGNTIMYPYVDNMPQLTEFQLDQTYIYNLAELYSDKNISQRML